MIQKILLLALGVAVVDAARLTNCAQTVAQESVEKAEQEDIRPRWAALTGHTGMWNVYGLRDAALSPDGKLAVTGGNDGQAILWDVATGKMLRVFPAGSSVSSVLFMPDGKSVLTGLGKGSTILWDVKTGEPIREFAQPSTYTHAIALSRDGRRLVTAHSDGSAQVWDVATGELQRSLETEHSSKVLVQIRGVAISADGGTAVLASFSGVTTVWNLGTGKKLSEMNHGNRERLVDVAVSEDGRVAATSALTGNVFVWDTQRNVKLRQFKLGGRAEAVALSAKGDRVVVAHSPNVVTLWDIDMGNKLAEFDGHELRVQSAAFSPDGTRVITSSTDLTAIIWDAKTGKRLQTLKGDTVDVHLLGASADGWHLLAASRDNSIVVWDLRAGEARRIPTKVRLGGDLKPLHALSRDGARAATVTSEQDVVVWDTSTIKQLQAFKLPDEVTCTSLDRTGTRLATGLKDGSVAVWDVVSGKNVRTLDKRAASVESIALSPDGESVLVGYADGKAAIWQVSTGKQLHEFQHGRGVKSAAWNSLGTQVLTADSGEAFLRDARSGKSIRRFGIRSGYRERAYLSGDDRLVLIQHQFQDAGIVDAATGTPVGALYVGAAIPCLAFSHNGSIVWQTKDHHIIGWNVKTKTELIRLLSINAGEEWLACTPACSYDGSPGVLQRIGNLVQKACSERASDSNPRIKRKPNQPCTIRLIRRHRLMTAEVLLNN